MIPSSFSENCLVVDHTALLHCDRHCYDASVICGNSINNSWSDTCGKLKIVERHQILCISVNSPSMRCKYIRKIICSHSCFHEVLIITAVSSIFNINTRVLFHEEFHDMLYSIKCR